MLNTRNKRFLASLDHSTDSKMHYKQKIVFIMYVIKWNYKDVLSIHKIIF